MHAFRTPTGSPSTWRAAARTCRSTTRSAREHRVKLRVAIPILLGSAAIMLSSIGLAIAQERPEAPQVRIPRPGQRPIVPGQPNQEGGDEEAPRSAGKLRPFRTGLEERPSGRVPPGSQVEFTLEDADLPDLVRMISRITGKRFIIPT